MSRLVLVTCLGVNPQEACYEIKGITFHKSLAVLALVEWLKLHGQSPSGLLALCTPQAQKTYDSHLYPELKKVGIPCSCWQIDPKKDFSCLVEGMATGLRKVVGSSAERKAEVIVDFTHGFRHHQLALMIAVQQLEAMGEVAIREAYYGQVDGELVPITQAIELGRWIEAYRLFRETGLTRALAGLLRDAGNEHLGGLFERLGWCYQGGLVVGVAEAAKEILASRQELESCLEALPLGKDVARVICEEIGGYCLDDLEKLSWKHINMQLQMLQRLWRAGIYPVALSLLYELVLSWVILECVGEGIKKNWADGGTRKRVNLWIMQKYSNKKGKKGENSETQGFATCLENLLGQSDEIGDQLGELKNNRNIVAHHGLVFQPERKERWEGLYKFWTEKISAWLEENHGGQR